MPFYERGEARIHYEETGSGFPLFIIYGGGLDSSISFPRSPFDAVKAFKSRYRCITMDLRNSTRGQSTGPLDLNNPWDMYTEDQLGLLDHLGVDKFFVLGFCIGNPLIWNLIKHAPGRVVAAVSAQPSGIDPKNPDVFYDRNVKKWGVTLRERRPEITAAEVETFLRKMYKGKDFVITASRDFVRRCAIPLLVLADDTDSHPYVTAVEMARLAPNAQMSLYPWKDTKENTELAVRHIRTFLQANRHLVETASSGGGSLTPADRLEIYDLIARYNFSEDGGEIEPWVDTFTQDGSFAGLRQKTLVAGHDDLKRFAVARQQRPDVRKYVHWTGNVVITPTDEGARAQSYVMMVEQTQDGQFRIRGMATKTDELRREHGQWRFKSRVNKPWPAEEAAE